MNAKLETLKNALVCLCLIAVLFTSCRRDKTTTALVQEIGQLKAVVMETEDEPVGDDQNADIDDGMNDAF